ncbi:hypothetical protein BC936DRAFT_143646 [Jimgerdemannia flammicorona]|uniref:Ran guanine nucleotide release factor n=1 Tax=Jimgerdemannia flammicorona TaxID=994334 RepID=A0A432ZYY8_9FUNG|nr:hypothetical protein BC936DRAFT_143646 [Jimgerdemannia flammicorona]
MATPTPTTTITPLFGGAITAYIPPAFVDSSDFRKIPDNQEVYVDVATDQSIIIELLQMVEEAEGEGVARYHFQQLGEDNDAADTQITSIVTLSPAEVPNMPPTAIPILLTGTQSITKFNESGSEATNFVGILLAVIRLPQVTTDMVISYNLPLAIGPQSSSRVIAAARPASPEAGLEEFKRVLASLLIKDWGLFQ